MASFYVENFGCRATQADGAAIERQFQDRGLGRAQIAAQAQVVVLNTCTVTAAADQDARAAIRRIHRENPGCQIVVTGCYAQRAPAEIAALPGVSQVVGNSHKHRLAEIALPWSECHHQERLQRLQRNAAEGSDGFVPLSSLTTDDRRRTTEIFVSDIFAHTELLAAPVFGAAQERTRPNLKVQDGCDNRCSFCVIPEVRGNSRSLPLERVLHEVNVLVDAGYREVVISGINLGRWGRDLPAVRQPGTGPSVSQTTDGRRLTTLIRSILDETSLEKLRISSVEPMDWSHELIALMASSARIAKHAHVPMQSGSDAVLRRMHRKYRPWHYREKIEAIRAAMPMAAIGADVMVGFPGETDTEFEETRRMVEELSFTYLHVFTYSARPGTPAAGLANQVPVNIARERNRVLRELAVQKKLAFMRGLIGKQVEAITLNSSATGVLGEHIVTEALTENYLKLKLQGRHQSNRWITAQVAQVENGALEAA